MRMNLNDPQHPETVGAQYQMVCNGSVRFTFNE